MIRKTLLRLGAGACALLAANAAQAQDMYMGQIITVGFNYCPEGTLEANGQTLLVGSYSALYALYGTTYGGSPGTNFALPDLRGRVQIGRGQGSSLTNMTQGGVGGQEAVSLTVSQMPTHNHSASLRAVTAGPTTNNPSGNVLATFPTGQPIYGAGTPSVDMATGAVTTGFSGSGSATPVRDPYLVLRYCVVTSGFWPPMP